MTDQDAAYSLKLLDSMHKIPAQDWDRFAGTANPFLSHAFLLALEESGSAIAETGWQPHHMMLYDADQQLAGVCPLYAKYHSYGEYIFDHAWADALERAGGSYYPKLLSAVPFTPATGPRLLSPSRKAQLAMLQGMTQIAGQAGVSSVHLNFVPEEEAELAGRAGYQLRVGMQYHWTNQDYQSFDCFLDALTQKKRKAIRKERRDVDPALTIKRLTGDDLKPHHWDAFFDFYKDTSSRKWGEAYLTRAFFDHLHQTMRNTVLLVMAFDGATPIAGALNLIGEDTLFGRNWGCLEHAKFLHFELCYYQAIDFAIERGLKTVEAGAQGHHKMQRGYLPSKTYSLHWLANDSFKEAVGRYLTSERDGVEREISALIDQQSPFKTTA